MINCKKWYFKKFYYYFFFIFNILWTKMNVESEFENIIKLLLIGDSAVGKTNFIFRYVNDSYTSNHL